MSIRRALASCRRVFLLLLLSLTLLGSWMYWQSPGLDTLKPSLERYLQQELGLQELKLGQLSWYWAGFLWLQVDQLDFVSKDNALAFHQGSADVRIPVFSMLLRKSISPDLIRLKGGTLSLEFTDSAAAVVADHIVLEGVDMQWRYGDLQGRIPAVDLALSGSQRRLSASSPSLQLEGQLDADGLPHTLTLLSQHADWLPDALARHLQGDAQFMIDVQRQGPRSWALKLNVSAEQPVSVMPDTMYALQLNQFKAELGVTVQSGGSLQPEVIDFHRLYWALADNQIAAHGRWQKGELTLQAESEQLAMPLLWSWLRPLGDQQWRHWLSLMHDGAVHQVHGELTLPWPAPLSGLPVLDLRSVDMQYHFQAQVEDADIALGISDDSLRHANITVDMDQQGMHASFLKAELPRAMGHTSGDIFIPWDTLELRISGQANTDVEQLLNWFGPSDISGWSWHQARANSVFKLIWDTSAARPKAASAVLKPDGQWDIAILGLPLQLSSGEVQWDLLDGLSLKEMHIKNGFMHSVLSLQAAPVGDDWEITGLKASGEAELALLAAHFKLPMSDAGGTVTSTLSFDNHWSGAIDMQQASWAHLLGSDKKAGEPLLVEYQGDVDLTGPKPMIRLNNVVSKGEQMVLHAGSASISKQGLSAQLSGLHTPSFSGSLNIDLPFESQKPWQIAVKASYLNRKALPEQLEQSDEGTGAQWKLRADIDRFDWDQARMSGVHIRLSSEPGSIGVLEAAQVHTSQMDIMDVDARFSLPGKGHVELRTFSASLEKQHLSMSATLTPEPTGGMRWQGFATLNGDFGHLMGVTQLSRRFLGGDAQVLFSGQGVVLREQPWWQGLDGRLRLRVDKGRILEGGSLSTLLAAINLSKLPALLIGQREDLTGPGLMYQRLQMEAIIQNQDIRVRNVVMRSTAFDLAGHGSIDVNRAWIDMYLIAKPLQNLDAVLAKIPLLRDILGGKSHSLVRKVYHMHGPFTDAAVDAVEPESAGLASAGLIESLFALPGRWFGSDKKVEPKPQAVGP